MLEICKTVSTLGGIPLRDSITCYLKMKRNQTILSIIWGLTIILCGYALYRLLQLPDRIEWFQLYGQLYYVIIFASIYIFILAVIGVVTRLLKKDISKPILNGIKWSILMLIITIGIGIFSGQRKVSETVEQMGKEWKLQQQQDSTNYINLLDSLNTIIRSESANYIALIERGLIKRQNGQYEASISDYELALKIKTDDFNANLEMGYSLVLIDKKVEADEYFRIAANLDTNSYFAKTNRHYIDNEKKNGR